MITHNFRPGVMEKIGLDYDSVKAINPKNYLWGNQRLWQKRPLERQARTGSAFAIYERPGLYKRQRK